LLPSCHGLLDISLLRTFRSATEHQQRSGSGHRVVHTEAWANIESQLPDTCPAEPTITKITRRKAVNSSKHGNAKPDVRNPVQPLLERVPAIRGQKMPDVHAQYSLLGELSSRARLLHDETVEVADRHQSSKMAHSAQFVPREEFP